MPTTKRATLERRSDKERRKIFSLHRFFSGGLKDAIAGIEGQMKKGEMAV